MPIILACPSCGGKLRVNDALYGQRVRCPACRHIFDGPAEPSPSPSIPPEPQDLPLDLTIDEPSAPPSAPSITTPGLVGAIELTPTSEEPPLSAGTPPPKPSRQKKQAKERLDFDIPDLRRLGPRRDAEPDRGSTILALGIISLAGLIMGCIPILGIILIPICGGLGLAAWIMGQIDLRKMRNGQMDERGRGTTQAGWICGIVGTLLNGLLILGCGLYFSFIGVLLFNDVRRLPNTRPIPVTRPPQKAPQPVLPPKRGNKF